MNTEQTSKNIFKYNNFSLHVSNHALYEINCLYAVNRGVN